MNAHIHSHKLANKTTPKLNVCIFLNNTRIAQYILSLMCFLICFNTTAQQSNLGTVNTITSTPFIDGTFNVDLSATSTGLAGWESCPLIGSCTSTPIPDRAIDASLSNFARANIVAAGSATLKVFDDQTPTANTYNAGNFAGFVVENSSVLGLLGNITIRTYLNGGAALETRTSAGLVATSLLSTRYEVGFYTTKPFNQIEITIGGVLTTVDVYYAIMRGYTAGPAITTCNSVVALNLPTYPAVINPDNTSSNVTNRDNAVTASTTDFASFPALALLAPATSISVKDQVTNYNTATTPDSYFVGFDIASNNLLDLSLLSQGGYRVVTYLDGARQDSSSNAGNHLLFLGLLSSNRQKIGFTTIKPFDEIKLITDPTLVAVGATDIFGAVVQKFCAGPAITACNSLVALNLPTYPVAINPNNTSTNVLNRDNATSASTSDSASFPALSLLAPPTSLSVKDEVTNYNTATTPDSYFVGFDIKSNNLLNLSLLGSGGYRVVTYLDGIRQDSSSNTGNQLLSVGLLSSTRQKIGFITIKPFDEIKLITDPTLIAVGPTDIFGAVVQKFCAGPALACNTPTPIVKSAVNPFPAIVDPAHTGFTGTVVVGNISNTDNAIDADLTNHADINFTVGVLATASFAVKDAITDYPAGTYAGFDIAFPTIANVNLIESYSIATYLNGVRKDSVVYTDLASVPTSLLSANGRKKVGIIATQAFDEVKITFTRAVSVNVGTVEIYSAIFETFCNPPALDCNTQTIMRNGVGGFPVYVSAANTSPTAACVGCSVSNTDNVIDNDPATFASMNVLVAAAGQGASLSVINPLTDYTAGTFVGFDIENQYLLGANAFSGITISTYLNGNATAVESKTSNSSLIAINSSLLTESGRQIVGFVTTQPFDELRISLTGLVTAQIANPTKVYSAIIQRSCAAAIACNNTYWLNSGNGVNSFPVVIDGSLTGFSGLACVGCAVENAGNVITPSTTDYATIKVLVGAASSGSLAVRDAVSTYPIGTFAGFAIRNLTGVVDVDLFNSLTISIFKKGVLREAKSANNLLDLKVLLPILGTGAGNYNIGFVTSFDFDEIRITASALVGVNAINNEIRVYGAFVDTRTSSGTGSGGTLNCGLVLNPDFNATLVNIALTGNVSTNDKTTSGTPTYGTPIPAASNSAGATISMNANGTYTFSATTAGVYTYTVPVCPTGVSTNCPTAPLVISVSNPTVNTNAPVANADIATLIAGTGANVVVKTLANDGCSNAGCSLNPALTVSVQPTHGTAVVTNANGDITYTPTAGFTGTDSLTYSVCDYQSPTPKCATAKQYFTVSPSGVANTTVAADDFIDIGAHTTGSGNVKTNDSDPEGNPQTVTSQTTTIPGKGTLVLQTTGTYLFTPVNGFTGPVEFAYTTCDNNATQACASATLHILVIDMAPKAENDHIATIVNQAVSGNLKTNDADPEGGTLTYNTLPTTAPAHGSVSSIIASSGQYIYTPTMGYIGVDSFKYTVCNAAGLCTTAWAYISVTPGYNPGGTNNAPIAQNDYSETFTNNPISGNAKSNDIEPDGNTVTYSVVNQPAHGLLVLNTNGTYTYTPTTGYNGKDTAKYRVCDNSSVCATALIEFVIKPDANGAQNNPPIASDDVASTPMSTAVSGNVLNNDTDANGSVLTASVLGVPATGNLQFASDGSYTYTPPAGFVGTIAVPYSVCNTGGLCDVATLAIVVQPVLIPDLVPIITVVPTVTNGIANFVAIVNVYEINAVPTSPTIPVQVYISKNAIIGLTFDGSATDVNGNTVQNSAWTMSTTDPNYYIFTTTISIPASGKSTIGLRGVLTPNAGTGKLNITETIFAGSGGEIKSDNNFNAGTISFFP